MKVWDPLELKLQVVVRHLTWVLGAELWSSKEPYALLTAELLLQLEPRF